MAIDEQQDWVDRAMPQGTWEPPDGFSRRVVVASMAVLPSPAVRTLSREGLVAVIVGFRESIRARIEMLIWVLTQYRELLFGSR